MTEARVCRAAEHLHISGRGRGAENREESLESCHTIIFLLRKENTRGVLGCCAGAWCSVLELELELERLESCWFS